MATGLDFLHSTASASFCSLGVVASARNPGLPGAVNAIINQSPDYYLRSYGAIPGLKTHTTGYALMDGALVLSPDLKMIYHYQGERFRGNAMIHFGRGATEKTYPLEECKVLSCAYQNPLAKRILADVSGQQVAPREPECPVCFNDLSGVPLMTCSHHHAVCKSCYDRLQTPKRCPVCRMLYSIGEVLRTDIIVSPPEGFISNSFTTAYRCDLLFLGWFKRVFYHLCDTKHSPIFSFVSYALERWYDRRSSDGYDGLMLDYHEDGRILNLDPATCSQTWREFFSFIQTDEALGWWLTSDSHRVYSHRVPQRDLLLMLNQKYGAEAMTHYNHELEFYGEEKAHERLRKETIFRLELLTWSYQDFLRKIKEPIDRQVTPNRHSPYLSIS